MKKPLSHREVLLWLARRFVNRVRDLRAWAHGHRTCPFASVEIPQLGWIPRVNEPSRLSVGGVGVSDDTLLSFRSAGNSTVSAASNNPRCFVSAPVELLRKNHSPGLTTKSRSLADLPCSRGGMPNGITQVRADTWPPHGGQFCVRQQTLPSHQDP